MNVTIASLDSSINLLSFSTECSSIDTDGAFLYFTISVETKHAFPEHALKPLLIKLPSHDFQVMPSKSAFSRRQTLSIQIPIAEELIDGDTLHLAYSFTLKKIRFLSVSNTSAISWMMTFDVFTKIVNTNVTSHNFASSQACDLAKKQLALSIQRPHLEEISKESFTSVLSPAPTCFTKKPEHKANPLNPQWTHNFTNIQFLSSAAFF